MAKAYASPHPLSGPGILDFLRTFQGAAASFARGSGHWSLWLPEFSPDERPLTPASQVFFPVILRHDEHAFAIRFFYDCSTGKVRYYTSAIPDEIARLPEFENAISELFRHSLPVEPICQRSLGRPSRASPAMVPPPKKHAAAFSLADPAELSGQPPRSLARTEAPVKPVSPFTLETIEPARTGRPGVELMPGPVCPTAVHLPAVAPSRSAEAAPREIRSTVHVEIGSGVRAVLMAFVVTLGFIALAAVGAYTYLRATEDPGVLHHRLQIEEMRQRTSGR